MVCVGTLKPSTRQMIQAFRRRRESLPKNDFARVQRLEMAIGRKVFRKFVGRQCRMASLNYGVGCH